MSCCSSHTYLCRWTCASGNAHERKQIAIAARRGYNQQYIYIRHRAFRHEKRVRSTPLAFSDLLRSGAVCSLVLRTHRIPAFLLACPVFGQFCTFFPKHFFYNDLYQKCSHGTPQNTPKSQKSAKNLASERIRGRAMQKSYVWKGLNSKSKACAMF